MIVIHPNFCIPWNSHLWLHWKLPNIHVFNPATVYNVVLDSSSYPSGQFCDFWKFIWKLYGCVKLKHLFATMIKILFIGCSPQLAPLHASCIPFHVRFYLVVTLTYYIVMLTINFEDGIRVR
jgi:hypothetical protein